MLTVWGVMITPKTYALTATPIITISENLANFMIRDINEWKVTFPLIRQYCSYYQEGQDVDVKRDISCSDSYYQKIALTTHKTIDKTIKSYEKRYPDIRQRAQRLKTAIDYAEKQRDTTTNIKKKFVYDWIRLELYNYTSNLDDGSNEICTALNDIFEDEGFCDNDIIIEETNSETVTADSNNTKLKIKSIGMDSNWWVIFKYENGWEGIEIALVMASSIDKGVPYMSSYIARIDNSEGTYYRDGKNVCVLNTNNWSTMGCNYGLGDQNYYFVFRRKVNWLYKELTNDIYSIQPYGEDKGQIDKSIDWLHIRNKAIRRVRNGIWDLRI